MKKLTLWRARLDGPAIEASAALAALCPPRGQGYLLEKAQEERAWTVGADPVETLRVVRGEVVLEAGTTRRILPGNPFAALGRHLEGFRAVGERSTLPFSGGAVGWLGYEMARHLENLPARPRPAEEGCIMVFDSALVCDRSGRLEWACWLPAGPRLAACRRRAQRRAEEIRRRLKDAVAARPRTRAAAGGRALPLRGAMGREAFLAAVGRVKEHIRAGDIFQGVLSERFRVRTKADPLEAYRVLREMNPSPYHFLIRDGGRAYLGASPERLVRVDGAVVRLCPIAGTRPRGGDAAGDRRLEAALRRSPKERAEHLMLVDLGRNDLGRVCAPGSIKADRYMDVRRFSNVMHLVSELEGRLERGRSAWDALAASFPAGTVSGAPKVRAMEILSELEPAARGFYSGAIVQRDFLGNLDSCIAIRCVEFSGGRAALQAGAGIVADSDPAREYQEVLHKLAAPRRALEAAV